METVVAGSAHRTLMPVFLTVVEHECEILGVKQVEVVIQPGVPLSLIVGRIRVADGGVVGHIVTAEVGTGLEVIGGSRRRVSGFGEIVHETQGVVGVGDEALDDLPVDVHVTVDVLTGLMAVAGMEERIGVVSLQVFAVSHDTAITAGNGIVGRNTRDGILHVTAAGVAGIVVGDTVGIAGETEVCPVAVETGADRDVLQDLVVIVETGVVTPVVIVDLHTGLVHQTEGDVEVGLLISAAGRERVVLQDTGTHVHIIPVGVREAQRIDHAHGQPLVDRTILEVVTLPFGTVGSGELMQGQRTRIVIQEVVSAGRGLHSDGSIEIDAGPIRVLTGLGGDQDDAVGSAGSVNGS